MYKIIHGFAPALLTEIFSSASFVRPQNGIFKKSPVTEVPNYGTISQLKLETLRA
jgi:hypothetical protein